MADTIKVILDLDSFVQDKMSKELAALQQKIQNAAKQANAPPGTTFESNIRMAVPRGYEKWSQQHQEMQYVPWKSASEKAMERLSAIEAEKVQLTSERSSSIDDLVKGLISKDVLALREKAFAARQKVLEEEKKAIESGEGSFTDDPLSMITQQVRYTVPETADQRLQAERENKFLKDYLEKKRRVLVAKQNEAKLRADKAGLTFETFSEEGILEQEKLVNASIALLNEEIKIQKATKASSAGGKLSAEEMQAKSKAALDKLKKQADLSHTAKLGIEFPFTGPEDVQAYEKQFNDWKHEQAKEKARKTFEDKKLRKDAEDKAKENRAFNAKMRTKYTIPALRAEIAGLASSLGKEVPALESQEPTKMVKEMLRQKAAFNRELNAKLKKEKEGQDRGKHLLMSSASIGIGLLGSSAMPLLNVAFASWSGGLKMAIPAAIATALGETIRGIDALREAANHAAVSLDFVSRNAKLSSAAYEGTKAFYGSLVQTSRTASEKVLHDFIKKNPSSIADFEAKWGGTWAGTARTILDPRQTAHDAARLRGKKPGDQVTILDFLAGAWMNISDTTTAIKNQQLPELRSALRERQRLRQMPSVGIENDPYSIWMRVQEQALSGKGEFEEKLLKESTDAIKEQIKKLETNNSLLQQDIDLRKSQLPRDMQDRGMYEVQGISKGLQDTLRNIGF